jgi:hypothetical protein
VFISGKNKILKAREELALPTVKQTEYFPASDKRMRRELRMARAGRTNLKNTKRNKILYY